MLQMKTGHGFKIFQWFKTYRFHLLLPATLMVLIIPVFFREGFVSEVIFFSSFTYLLIQSMLAASERQVKHNWRRGIVVFIMIVILWLEPAGVHNTIINNTRLLLLVLFFVFIIYSLSLFIRRSKTVNIRVILVAINIYLLIGISFGNLALLLNWFYPAAYTFPPNIQKPVFVDFVYFSFVTMSTVGYGDFLPAIRQSQMLAYITAITGQLYVAIIMAIIVGKYLAHSEKKSPDEQF